MPMNIGFTSPNQVLFDKYARHGEGSLAVVDRAALTIAARAYSGYLNGSMARMAPPYPEPVVLRLTSIQSGAAVLVAEWSGDISNWLIKPGQFSDGNYEVTSNIPGTLGFTLQIRIGALIIPPSKYLLQRPAYMPASGGFPTNINTKIIEFKGIRTGDSSPPVPFSDGGNFTKPFVPNDLWSESFGTNLPAYEGCAWPSTTPLGGLHYVAKQRYTYTEYASVVPDVDGYSASGPPSERLDGGPGTGGAGVVPSGFRNSDGAIYLLASTGSIIRVDPKTRAMKTVYGWVKKPGTAQPVESNLMPEGAGREAWLKQFFEFKGAGPTISRAWQMCKDANNENMAYVADCTNHTVVRVDLQTSFGITLAGTIGGRGWRDGDMGTALFDQPRGICMIKTGAYAGKLVVADEHNSAFRLVDPLTGATTTLSRAKRVPTVFPGSFVGELTRTVNRIAFGAPTNADGTYNDAFKTQVFADAQFCHPVHLAVLSDGKTVVSVHHDEYRGFRLDLDAGTLTHLFDFQAAASRPDVSPKDWPTVHADTNGSMGYGIDSLWVCSWHHNNREVRSGATGLELTGTLTGDGTCGDHRGLRDNAYSRSMIVLGDGSFIFNGDAQNSLCRVRRALPTDPVIDKVRYERGRTIYRTDGAASANLSARASVHTQNGSVGVNYLVNLKTPGELAMLPAAARKQYMIDNFGVTDWSDQDHAEVAYFLDWNCPLGVQRIRKPGWGDIVPLGFRAALASVEAGASIGRLGASAVLSPADIAAVDWVAL